MFFSKLKLNSDSGYTLMELMAVIAIIGIMSVVAAASYSGIKQKTALEKAASQLALDLRRAQNMAMNTAVFAGSVPNGGYGIYLTAHSATYTLYADNGDKQYNIPPPVIDGVVAENNLDFPVLVSTITGDITSIDFLPPNPNVFFDGVAATANITITLEYGASGLTKTITINGLTGQISVN